MQYTFNISTLFLADWLENNSRFSHDVTAAMLEPLNKETAAMLELRPNPPGI